MCLIGTIAASNSTNGTASLEDDPTWGFDPVSWAVGFALDTLFEKYGSKTKAATRAQCSVVIRGDPIHQEDIWPPGPVLTPSFRAEVLKAGWSTVWDTGFVDRTDLRLWSPPGSYSVFQVADTDYQDGTIKYAEVALFPNMCYMYVDISCSKSAIGTGAGIAHISTKGIAAAAKNEGYTVTKCYGNQGVQFSGMNNNVLMLIVDGSKLKKKDACKDGTCGVRHARWPSYHGYGSCNYAIDGFQHDKRGWWLDGWKQHWCNPTTVM